MKARLHRGESKTKASVDDEIVNKRKKKMWGQERANSGGDSDRSSGSDGERKKLQRGRKADDATSCRRSTSGPAAKPSPKCICDIYIYAVYIYIQILDSLRQADLSGQHHYHAACQAHLRDCACDCMAVIRQSTLPLPDLLPPSFPFFDR